MADIEATFVLEEQPAINADFNIDVQGITEHNLLVNRDFPNQHPISAITGLETALSGKQDTISDLSEIRSGAALGATAVQPNDLNYYATIQYVDNGLSEKQDTLTAGANIQIVGNTISATDTTYTAGQGISIVGNVISNTQTSAEWGNITGTLSNQTDLRNALNGKQNVISDLSTIRTNATKGASAYTTIQGYGNIVTHNVSEFATSAQGTLADSAVQPADLATVATSGSYNDLTDKPTIPAAQVNSDWNATSGVAQILNKPTIPTDTSDLTNGAGYITSSALSSYAVDSNVVHKTGNETVGGVKTFSSDMYITNNQPFLYLRQTSFDKGDVPASQISASVNFLDSSEVLSGAHQLSSIGTEILTSGDIRCFLRAFKNAVNVSTNAQIAIYYPTTGSAYTECPTPTEDTTTSKQIDTVGARNTALSSYVLSSSLATVAISGDYDDLINKPIIPAAQVNSDWNAVSGVAQILNKPTLATVATTGAYSDLSGTPTIPTDTSDLTNGAGYITGITSSDVTTALGYTPYNASNPSGYITSSALSGYATESYVTTATANMQTTGNLVTSISSSSTDSQYPSAKCIYDIIGDVETLLSQV